MSIATVPSAYDRHREANRQNMAAVSRRGRNIGEIPPVADPDRRAETSRSFRLFCEVYFAETFSLGWSDDHIEVISRIEDSVLRGGLFAMAMPRGSGKTSLCEAAAIWAMVNGLRDFVSLIGADAEKAGQMLDSIKTEFESNELMEADFPEVCVPIIKLEGISNRCGGQHYNDRRTHIGWTKKEIILPTVQPEGWGDVPALRPFVREGGYSLGSGAIVRVAGITGGIRGMKHKKADGAAVRPSLVILDDPQTDQSARSPSQCETRERILAGAILGLAGPGKKIAGIMPCTVVTPGDMADRILDNDKHPRWNGKRTKMVYAFPEAEKLWDEYAAIRKEQGPGAATAFYSDRRAEMDRGAVVAWAERHNEDELSAIQHAMNLRIDDERSFFAEYQNEPLPDYERPAGYLPPDAIAAKVNRHGRATAPLGVTRVTAFIDVHTDVHYYSVVGWEDDFTGYVLDYGTLPDQRVGYFTKREARANFEKAFPSMGVEGRIYAGLEAATRAILGREYARDDGTALRVERCLVDANYGQQTSVVYKFCRESAFASILTPSHGKGIGASSRPISEYTMRPGERKGLNWYMPVEASGKRAIRKVIFDANYWKSFVHARLAVSMGDKGCLSLFGDRPDAHRLYADHLTAEYPVPVTRDGSSRTVDEWKPAAGHPDNHYLDTLVGCAVAASVAGVVLPEAGGPPAPPGGRRRVTFKDLQDRGRKGT